MKHQHTRLRMGVAGASAAALAALPLAMGPAQAASVSHAVPVADHLVAHYDFNGDPLASGTVVDRSGHGLDATVVNKGTAAVVPGALPDDSALDLPGGSPSSLGAYVELPKPLLAGTADLTVSARVRWDGNGGNWQRIFDLGQDTSRYLFATPSNGDGNFRAAVTSSFAGGESVTTGYAALPASAWKTVTVTLDTAQHRVSLYLDGALVDAAATNVTAAQLLTDSATRAGYIGKSQYVDPLFNGAVDDFQVYDAALSADQVAQLVGAEAPTLTRLSQTSFDIRTSIGVTPSLPASIRAGYSDGFDRNAPATWEPIDPSSYASRGKFTVHGTAGGQDVTAQVTVTRPNELSIDL